jgi:hypothetical protein
MSICIHKMEVSVKVEPLKQKVQNILYIVKPVYRQFILVAESNLS